MICALSLECVVDELAYSFIHFTVSIFTVRSKYYILFANAIVRFSCEPPNLVITVINIFFAFPLFAVI